MTQQEFRDEYAKKQGYLSWSDLYYTSGIGRRNHTDQMMQQYALEERKWISVKEKLPIQTRQEESNKVLVYKTDINGNKETALMRYNHLQGFWNTITGTCKVTHWQPLPESPKPKRR